MPSCSKWSSSFRFPQQNPASISFLSHTCYRSYPSHSSWFEHMNNIWWHVEIFLSTTFLITFMQCSSLNVRDKAWHPFETIIALYVLIFKFHVSKWEGKTFWTERFEAFLVIDHSLLSACMQFWLVTVMRQILFCTYHVALSNTVLLE